MTSPVTSDTPSADPSSAAKSISHNGNGFSRRAFVASAAAATVLAGSQLRAASPEDAPKFVVPPTGKRILLSCKLSMIPSKNGDTHVPLVDRLKLAKEAGFDGVDFDECGNFTLEAAKEAVQTSGVYCHNGINHAHWSDTLTNREPEIRAKGVANIEHCIRLSHAIGGSGVLIVVGRAADGTQEEVESRAAEEIRKLIPLAAALGQPILIENVWNQMFYDHSSPPEQSAERFVKFVDSFNSRWVGMYYDIGNHWKYGQPRKWLQEFGYRAVKLDVKGFSRKKDKFVDITSPEDDLPWEEVQQGLKDIEFTGWATAEVGGGNLERLTTVRQQMEKAFGLV